MFLVVVFYFWPRLAESFIKLYNELRGK